MKPKTRMDYVKIYGQKMRKDSSLFRQQKMLIESQLQSSSQIFRSMFGDGKDFEKKARVYLRKVGMIRF